MGGAQSKTAIKQISEQCSSIAATTVQSCEVSAQQDQSLEVVNTGFKLWGTYKLDQQSEIRADCFSDVKKQVELQNKLIQAISQASTAQNVGILGAFGSSKAEAEANLTNIIRNNITMSNIQRSYTSIKQRQAARFNNSGVVGFESVELTQGSKLFAAATLQEMDRAGIFNMIESHVSQQASAKVENPLDFIARAIGAVSGYILVWILLFVVIVAAVVLGVVFMSGGARGDQQYDNMYSTNVYSTNA